MTEENIELTVEELNSIAGGRTLTDAEQQDILWAAKKIKSIRATDSYAKKILSHYADEYQKIYDKYMNLMRTNELGSDEILFRDYIKSNGSSTLYRILYETQN